MSGWTHPKFPYHAILCFIKEKGIRVYHREIKSGAGATFDCRKVIITIDKQYRDTWEGCGLLCHELSHFYDWREGKFKKFFEESFEYSEENMALVVEAEMSAIKGSVKLMKSWGIKYEAPELTESGYNKSVKFWREYYFS